MLFPCRRERIASGIKDRGMMRGPLLLLLSCVLLLFCGSSCFHGKRKSGPEAEADLRSSMASIQMAIERYATDNNGLYPADIEELVARKLLSGWPTNPFTGRRMKQVEWGANSPGDFFYRVGTHRFGYCIGAYAADPRGGYEGSGVAIFFYGGIDPSETYTPPLPGICKP